MANPRRNPNKEHGLAQERRIIDALRRERMSEFQLAAMMGIKRNTVTVYITRLREQGRVRIADYVRNVSGRPLPLFGLGSVDCEYIPNKVRKPKQPDRCEANRTRILALLEKPHTTVEIGEQINRTASIVRRYVLELRKEKLVRISHWKHSGTRNGWAPVYKLGKFADAKRPQPLSTAEYHRRSRADPEKREHEKKVRQIRELVKPLRTKPATWLTALGA